MGDPFLIRDMPLGERPRERLREAGPDALRNAELIAILLRTGMKGLSAVQIAEQALQKFGALDALARASVDQLCEVKGLGPDQAIALKSAFTLAKRLTQETHGSSPLLDTPELIADFLREDNRLYDVEHLQVLLLNTRRRLIRYEDVSQGLLDQLLAHPRDIFRLAISANAAAVVLAHNHPSGDPTPSEADVRVTRDVIRAGELLKIQVLDHVILGRPNEVTGKDYISMREMGFFYA
jgi:DNA repair protein RadC